MPRFLRRVAPLLLAALSLSGCVAYAERDPVVGVYDPAPGQRIHVPPGHMPPPGSCRIWFPDRPPGHQPPPGPCGVLRYRVPPGAVLVYG